jgi:short-subunit dehydrogenase
MNLDGCCALITGASAGIGRELARQLGSRAQTLVLVARRQARLEELRDELQIRHPQLTIHLLRTDLTDGAQLKGLTDWIEAERVPINFLINNAGLGDLGLFADSDEEKVQRMLKVNMVALTLLMHRLLPGILARKPGAILNVSSSAGFLPMAGFAVYAASKAYVTSLSEALRAELHGTGVTVTTLCPGSVKSEFTDVARRPHSLADPAPEIATVSVEKVVREALRAVEKDDPLVIPGLLMKFGMALVRLTPLSMLRVAARFSARRS